ncbi:MAG TPA: CDP-diacylglycerol--glycerol-3-phosphate 3-phosphatidyltransferase [Candidatus Cloacimonetes bacterium]|nr:CDP-diacylglycerol--glycerol-3-phosphate 3-phosphatidyltransferase [Candidatus Cloacimonadota bacterium]
MKKRIPNLLTIIRIILVPIFIWFVFSNNIRNNIIWATIIFIIACITDYFDGMLARRMKVISNFGKIMDPLADKILVISALFAISLELHYTNIIVVIIIIVREVAVTILRNYYIKKNIYIAANIWGKLKTIMQMVGITAALIYYSFISILDKTESKIFISGFHIFFWLVAVVTILSGLNYFFIKTEKIKKNS